MTKTNILFGLAAAALALTMAGTSLAVSSGESAVFALDTQNTAAGAELTLLPNSAISYSTDWAEGSNRQITITATPESTGNPYTVYTSTVEEGAGSCVWNYSSISDLPSNSDYDLSYAITSGQTVLDTQSAQSTIKILPEPCIALLAMAAALFFGRKIRKGVLCLAVLFASVSAFADISVTAAQRWPWNGKVDITYTIPSESGVSYYAVKFSYSLDGGSTWTPIRSEAIVSGDGAEGATFLASEISGTKKCVWDASVDCAGVNVSSAKVKVETGDIYEIANYVKIGLDSTKTSTYGILCSSPYGPDVSVGADSKIKEIWFKNVKHGTFTMGSSTSEGSGYGTNYKRNATKEVQHQVTLTKNYFFGVFELTQGQILELSGSNPSYHLEFGLFAPAEQLNYNKLRGSSALWPTSGYTVGADSYIDKMRKKFKDGNNDPKYIFDLPTEAQWEYACRAVEQADGTYAFRGDNVWNNGESYSPDNDGSFFDANLDHVGWNSHNAKLTNVDVTHEVGLLEPNGIGLYDMHGNVAELCLDYEPSSQSSDPVTDPVGVSSGSNRIKRGGWLEGLNAPNVKNYRIASRTSVTPDYNDNKLKYYGCRLVLMLP